MFFQQIVHSDIGCASYFLASPSTHEAVVVDPRWDIEPYLDIAGQHDFHITKIIETHNHADHVSGHGRLTAATGAVILVHDLAKVEYPHEALADGDIITVDDIRLHVLHLPGHRPEHIGLAIEDRSRGADPWMVLTGDSLFIGDVARPDLAVEGPEGARLLFESLHERLFRLPDFCIIYPAHVAGSLCGRVSSEVSSSTLGYEKRYNAAAAISERSTFVAHMNASLPQRPPNMQRIIAENRGPLRTEAPVLHRLTLSEVAAAIPNDAVPLDVRATDLFLAEHVPSSIHVPVGASQFGTRAGFVLDQTPPLILIASDEEEARAAHTQLLVVAFDNVLGWLPFSEWQDASRTIVRTASISVDELRQQLASHTVIDVRETSESESGIVPGALRIPYWQLDSRKAEVPTHQPVAVMCQSGARSAIAASVLERAGNSRVASVEGGVSAWTAAGYPVDHPTL